MKTGIKIVAAKRKRKIERQSRTAAHHDSHKKGELACAAQCYLNHAVANNGLGLKKYAAFHAPENWPFEREFWKPTNPTEDYARAAAFIIAEIDRRLPAAKE